MKILYDHQVFNTQIHGGISRYFYNLLNNFYNNKDINFKLSLIYSQNFYLKDTKFVSPMGFLQDKKFKGRDRLLNYFLYLNKLNSIFNLKLKNFDIFHPTEYNPYFLDYIGKPYVLTVYDMIHEIFYSDNKEYINNKKKLILGASKIIAISHNTKKDILKFINIPENKIEVTHLASSLDINLQEKVNLPEKYLLFVGNRGGYKNFEFFLNSINNLFKKYKSLYLVCVGGGQFTQKELDFIIKNNLKEKVLLLNLNDSQLTYVYTHALSFIFPSLYEGFGIPIIEAFSLSCPVILSKASCFPGIAQDAAVYFNPQDSESILESIEKIIVDKNFRSEKIKAGLIRSKDFSWEKTANKTKEIYKSIL